jgi:hypothetical protein
MHQSICIGPVAAPMHLYRLIFALPTLAATPTAKEAASMPVDERYVRAMHTATLTLVCIEKMTEI